MSQASTRVVALMTAKGNNTLARKNLLPVLGKPLIWYPATVARRCNGITDFYVSSDSQEIRDLCADIGYKPIVRPDRLALPQSQHVDAILHALQVMKADDCVPDILITLLGNTVFLKTSWLSNAIRSLQEDPSLTAVAAVYQEQDQHPFRARKINEDGCLVPYFDFGTSKISTNRQELPPNYYFSHNFWAIRLENGNLPTHGLQPWTFMGDKVKPLVIEEGFDVHTLADIERCEEWIKENNIFDE